MNLEDLDGEQPPAYSICIISIRSDTGLSRIP